MATEQSHVATTNPMPNSCVDCRVAITRRVSYVFHTAMWDKPLASEKGLHIPYALAIDGKSHSAYAKRAGVMKAYEAKSDIFVEPGQCVSLFLNSDAAPANRKNSVFAVTPKDHDIEVIIYEKRGKLGADDTPKLTETKEVLDKHGNRRMVDVYEATLTGDIWMKVSHKYSSDEAKNLIPADTHSEVREAVQRIYDGTQKGPLAVCVKNEAGQSQSVTLNFEAASNASENISVFDLYKDGLPRVHPQAWVAVIEAALSAGICKVETSSAWRPMLGAIVHRTGLGLDVNHLDTVRLNREELTGKKPSKDADDNVSDEEKKLFADKRAAEKETGDANRKLQKLLDEQEAIDKLKKTSPGKVNPLREAALPDEIEAADKEAQVALKKKAAADDAWNKERDKHEPLSVKSFRAELSKCKCVKQVFDPWFMNKNTLDPKSPVQPNVQKDGNEKLHATHLHVTIFDPTLPTS